MQIRHVVAAHHRNAPVQKTIAQPVARADESPPGVGTYDAVGGQTGVALEAGHCPSRVVGECTGNVGGGVETQGRQALLDITNRFTLVPDAVEPHGPMLRGVPAEPGPAAAGSTRKLGESGYGPLVLGVEEARSRLQQLPVDRRPRRIRRVLSNSPAGHRPRTYRRVSASVAGLTRHCSACS